MNSTKIKAFAFSLALIMVVLSFLALPVFAAPRPRPDIEIYVDKSNLPTSINIIVKVAQFRADAYRTDTVTIIISGQDAGGLCSETVKLNRAGCGSVTVTYPDHFVGGQYFHGFTKGIYKIDARLDSRWGTFEDSICFRVRR